MWRGCSSTQFCIFDAYLADGVHLVSDYPVRDLKVH